MKNKKGFSLVELLAVIVVIGIVVLLATSVINNVSKRTRNTQYNNLISKVEASASRYFDETGINSVYVQTLIDDGYIATDDGLKIYSPNDKTKAINCYYIEKVDGKVTVTPKNENECTKEDIYADLFNLVVCTKENCADSDYEILTDNWISSSNVTLAVKYKNTLLKNADVSWVFFDSPDNKTNNPFYRIETDYIDSKLNVHVTYKLNDKNIIGNLSGKLKVDKIIPKISNISVSNNYEWSTYKIASFLLTDNESKLKKYKVVENKNDCLNNSGYTNLDNKNSKIINYNISIPASELEKELYICLVDNANNNNFDVDNVIKYSKIDTSTPDMPVISAIDNDLTYTASDNIIWHKSNFNLEFYSSNASSIKSGVNYYYQFSNNSNVQNGNKYLTSYDDHNVTFIAYACSGAGNCSNKAKYKIRIDNKGPIYTSGGSINSSRVVTPTYTDEGVGGVTIYTCTRSSSSIPDSSHYCFKTNQSTYSSSCGNNYLFSYAVDLLGNKSEVKRVDSYNLSCYTPSYDDDYDPPSSPPVNTCDAACQWQNEKNDWNNANQNGDTNGKNEAHDTAYDIVSGVVGENNFTYNESEGRYYDNNTGQEITPGNLCSTYNC